MKSLTIFTVAALACVASAQQHHGALDHLDHDLVGHLDHDAHGRGPRPGPVEAPPALDFEIQTKPPVVVLTTITKTRPYAVVHHGHHPTNVAYAPDHDSDYEPPVRGHDRDHSNHVHDDHSQGQGRTRVRQKAVQDEKKPIQDNKKDVKSVASVKAPENHLAAAAVSAAATSAVRPAASSKAVVRPATSARTSSGSEHLRVGGTLVATAAGIAAWLLL
ncbi:hypothetical protein BY458DRAFT_557047 [Sporodiniella umbellata]|nr:hypothetical protein BY458DRAFT_557047 [Sporodiniella umbellata]